ncbi:hypothetical protein WMO63_05655 [Niallia sp. CLA-SR-H024]|uniref:Uncharacterized protein n=1 Tax=Niallia hominis TaxID=3133173 RepID=A0ABV1EVN8_9BACI
MRIGVFCVGGLIGVRVSESGGVGGKGGELEVKVGKVGKVGKLQVKVRKLQVKV